MIPKKKSCIFSLSRIRQGLINVENLSYPKEPRRFKVLNICIRIRYHGHEIVHSKKN